MSLSNLHRIKMDPNRKFTESCFDCQQESGKSYQDYHNLIKEYFCEKFMLNSSFEQGKQFHCIISFKLNKFFKIFVHRTIT